MMFRTAGLLCTLLAAVLAATAPVEPADWIRPPTTPVPNDEWMDVYVLPHSHDDVGWLKTMEEYYERYVSETLDTVVESLTLHPGRKFVIVEVAFFERWWTQQGDEAKERFTALLENGQIEFIHGGWVMADGTCSTYSAMTTQMSQGHRWLADTFGDVARPKVGWHIDPFGQVSTTPTLFHQMCFDAHVFARLSSDTRDHLRAVKGLEFYWEGSPDLGESTRIFTHILDSHYCTPDTFDFEWESNPDNPTITPANIKERADTWARMVRERGSWYMHNKLLIPFGCDFKFQNANIMYRNMERLMNFINDRPEEYEMNIHFTTLSEYINDVQALEDIDWPTYQGDFLPYVEWGEDVWSGIYSSRGQLKAAIRAAEDELRSSEIISVWAQVFGMGAPVPSELPAEEKAESAMPWPALEDLRRAVSVTQHHDGITGTARPHVILNYHDMISRGLMATRAFVREQVKRILLKVPEAASDSAAVLDDSKIASPFGEANTGAPVFASATGKSADEHDYGATLDFTHIEVNANGKPEKFYPFNLFNPLSYDRTEGVQAMMPKTLSEFAIYDKEGVERPCQELHHDDGTDATRVWVQSKYGTRGQYFKEIWFTADIPALGFSTYFLGPVGEEGGGCSEMFVTDGSTEDHPEDIENDFYRLTFSSSGALTTITPKGSKETIVNQHFAEYTGSTDGAYLIHPNGASKRVKEAGKVWTLAEGKLAEVMTRCVENPAGPKKKSLCTRAVVWKVDGLGEDVLIEHVVPPPEVNKAIVAEFTTDLQNDRVLYQDDGGLNIHRREHKTLETNPYGVNMYPMISKAWIEDEKSEMILAVASDYTHVVTSPSVGSLQVMLHRRTGQDDHRGLERPLDDKTVLFPRLRLILTPRNKPQSLEAPLRRADLSLNHRVMFWVHEPIGSIAAYADTHHLELTPLADRELPEQLHVVGLAPIADMQDEVTLRMVNLEFGGETAAFDPENWLMDWVCIFSVSEKILSGTIAAEECPFPLGPIEVDDDGNNKEGLDGTIHPTQIRTYHMALSLCH